MVRGARPADNACLTFARMWEYPLWCSVIRSEAAELAQVDACIKTKTCLHSSAIRDSQLTDVYVEDGVVRGIYVRRPLRSNCC